MKYLFVTGLYDIKHISEYSVMCKPGFSIQNAPNVLQWAIVDGLEKNNVSYQVVSYPFLPSYPRGYSRLFVDECTILYKDKIIGLVDKYCTLIGFKGLSIYSHLCKYTKNWILQNRSDRLCVILYSPDSYALSAIVKLKRQYPHLVICMIITDMVDDMLNFSDNQSYLKRIQTRYEQFSIKSLYQDVDKFILLSKHMVERIPCAIGKSIVIEGITNSNIDVQIVKDKIPNSFLYTGTLDTYAGIKELVDAFMMTNEEDYRLYICGSGCLSSYVKMCAAKDNRIIFKGLVSREEAVQLQKNCRVLVNPRKPDAGITKYSFPSKTMEYLSSGTPMIGYKLEGIPDEYFDFFYTIEGLSIETLKETMESVMQKSDEELLFIANKAREFICSQKNSTVQVNKIIDHLQS